MSFFQRFLEAYCMFCGDKLTKDELNGSQHAGYKWWMNMPYDCPAYGRKLIEKTNLEPWVEYR